MTKAGIRVYKIVLLGAGGVGKSGKLHTTSNQVALLYRHISASYAHLIGVREQWTLQNVA